MNDKRGFGKRAQGMVASNSGSVIFAVIVAIFIIGIIILFRERIAGWLRYFYDGIRFGFGG